MDNPITITITVSQCHNLRPLKGDTITVFLRFEHTQKPLGDSARLAYKTGEECNFNHSLSLSAIQGDTSSIGSLIQQPLVVSMFEALPKDKVLLMGQGCLDLLPLFQGRTNYFHSLPIHPLSPSTEDHPVITLDLEIVASAPLLAPGRADRYSLLSLQLHSLYSPPEQWATSPACTTYTFSLPIPTTEGHEPILMPNGSYRPKPIKDLSYDTHLRWSSLTGVSPLACVIPDRSVEPSVPDEEDGELRDKQDLEFRVEAETGKPRVVWNMEKRVLLGEDWISELKKCLSQCSELPIELVRTSPPPPQKGGKAKTEEEPSFSYHGVAFVSLSSLLYPGTSRITGAYIVHPYTESEVASRTQCTNSYVLGAQTSRSSAASAKVKQVKKSASSYHTGLESATEETAKEGEGPVFGRCYVHVSLELSRPLIQRKNLEELSEHVSDLIPPRSAMPTRIGGAEKAVRGYQQQIQQVATGLLGEMWTLFGDELGKEESASELEKRRIELQYQLNVTGRFYALKEQLKHSVVSLVRDKFQNKTAFKSEEEKEEFLSELYVHLVDQMHTGLGNTLLSSQYEQTPPSVQEPSLLKLFASEAIANNNYAQAAQYYQQRVAMRRNSADFWSEYGSFCMLVNNLPKAEECFKQAIACDQHHVPSLLLFGIVSNLTSRYEQAETFLEAASAQDPQAIEPWIVMGLHYEASSENGSNKNAVDMSFRRAESLYTRDQPKISLAIPKVSTSKVSLMSKDTRHSSREGLLNSKQIGSTAGTLADTTEVGEQEDEDKKQVALEEGLTTSRDSLRSEAIETCEQIPIVKCHAKSIFMVTAEFLLERNALTFAAMALGHHLVGCEDGINSEYETLLARLALAKGDTMDLLLHAKRAIALDIENVQAWEIFSHAQYLMRDTAGAIKSYERTLASTGELLDPHLVYLRLASIYLEEDNYTKSKEMFLHGCRHSPSALTWLGVGISCYRMQELGEAEEALAEANILNNLEPEIWAYLCMVCLRTGRQAEAEQTYRYALKCGLNDTRLIHEIEQLTDELQMEWNS
ncbi:hypothetical protein LOD99_13045 [Oopsacas minuta]|uniref:Cilia- and flagella-associated protein 70 n=1 Tax=Oopsacas minuta TaxID=111878 RepID=A0AAV7JAP5_9METZ|nr:hypothetical protein LOD99_13045 [Oopsacas minuta]